MSDIEMFQDIKLYLDSYKNDARLMSPEALRKCVEVRKSFADAAESILKFALFTNRRNGAIGLLKRSFCDTIDCIHFDYVRALNEEKSRESQSK